jgi:uncharacterized protein (DUF608 family)
MKKNNTKLKRLQRRDFLKQTGILTAGLLTWRPPFINENNPAALWKGMPSPKKNIDPEWIKSLYKRGAVTTYLKSKNELPYIGMPVGGINTGTLYLGGDGRLWLWDIFNLNQEGVNPLDVQWGAEENTRKKVRSRDGSAYVAPARSHEIRPLEQGFAVKIEYAGKTIVRYLREDDWPEISFEATYPVAKIAYSDASLPVEISMQAFSPFIPLDENNSGLPATVFCIHVKNNDGQPVKISIAGWLENKAAMYSALPGSQHRENTVFRKNNITGVYSTVTNLAYSRIKIEDKFDYGTLCLAALQQDAVAGTHIENVTGEAVFESNGAEPIRKSAQQKLIGNVITTAIIAAAKTKSFDFVISWHTPNLMMGNGKTLPEADRGHYYENQFKNAREVAEYIADNFNQLSSQTKLWLQTWYDSTLPYWFLDRSFLNISTLASTTSHRFKSGRYWAWEGVGACEGNCTHVWQYAQAPARIFPAMERDNRERVDLGISLQQDGGIWFRGEYDKRPAIDGQAGRILGAYREHQLSIDNKFLQRNWDKIKRAVQFVINQDRNKDGMEDTPLENTLDAVWDGEIAWIVGLCIAAVQAGELMATEMNDKAFASVCKEYVRKGKTNMEEKLFNGEYFIHRPDAEKGRKKIGSYNTSHIDQAFGQSWAFQVGLPRILNKQKTISALRALWKYNFMMDVGPYIREHKGGRPYALPGEGGMVMNTNPKNETNPYGEEVTWQLGYFHECMSGFEHQVASHMMAEGMTDEALVLTRVIHDRYHASKRNPFNEIECSDHYARAMASYGTFITACGFEYHGPKGYIRFAPKWNKENFKAPFTAAAGWGSYAQGIKDGKQFHRIEVKYGLLQLQTISLEIINAQKPRSVMAMMGIQKIAAKYKLDGSNLLIEFAKPVTVQTNQLLAISFQ